MFSKYIALHDNVTLKPITVLSDESIYYGEWHNKTELKHGRGIICYNNGDRFEGYIKDDMILNGKMIYNTGVTYEGEWKNDKQDGKGTETWLDGAIYTGDYKEGKKCGWGVFTWSDGSVSELV